MEDEIPLLERYSAFMNTSEDHDDLYDLFRQLLNRHHPAVLLKTIEGAMEDEQKSPTSQCDRNKVVLYQSILSDAIEAVYRDNG